MTKFTPDEILNMSPSELRKELTHACALAPGIAELIEKEIGEELKWSKMNTFMYTLVAYAWAKLECDSYYKMVIYKNAIDTFKNTEQYVTVRIGIE